VHEYRVKCVPATKLVNELVEAADVKMLAKTIARYGRVDLLCIDELGHMELDRRGAKLPCQVLTERKEKNSVAIASNESFGGWTKTLTDPRLCAEIVDRLTPGRQRRESLRATASAGPRTDTRENETPPARVYGAHTAHGAERQWQVVFPTTQEGPVFDAGAQVRTGSSHGLGLRIQIFQSPVRFLRLNVGGITVLVAPLLPHEPRATTRKPRAISPTAAP
jgi:hypothetical protein